MSHVASGVSQGQSFFKPVMTVVEIQKLFFEPATIAIKAATLHNKGHMLLLNINRKPYMGSPMTLSYLTLSDPEKCKARLLRFRSSISAKGAELGHMLLLNINRKACMGSPLVRLHWTLVTLKGQYQGHSDFEGLYFRGFGRAVKR